MSKIRVRSKTGGKGRRWPKGHSSDSNPPTNKYRSKARSTFFKPLSEPGKLTADSLVKHNAVLGISELSLKDKDGGTVASDAFSLNSFGQKSFNTFATDFTQCSLPSFDKLLSTVRKDSPVYREMLAILAAVTDTVREKSDGENVTEYFGALTSILECSEEESIQQIAITSLLSMCIRHVPRPVLIEKFEFCSKVFLEKYVKICESGNVLLIKSLTDCMAYLLRAQKANIWQDAFAMKVFSTILNLTTNSKPKIRKAGQNGVIAVILGSACMRLDVDGPAIHPAAAGTAKFCIQSIENYSLSGQTTSILHVLTLLHSVMAKFPKKELKSCIETLLKLMALMSTMVKLGCLVGLKNLMDSKPDVTVFPPTINAQLISSLYDFQPSLNDSQLLSGWLQVQTSALINLYNNDKNLSLSHVSHFFLCAVKCWTSSKDEVKVSVSGTLSSLIDNVLGYLDDEHLKTSETCFSSLMQALNYQYLSAWGEILKILQKYFEVCAFQGQVFIGPYLRTLVELRDTDDFCHVVELERAIGAAITSMGPKVLLDNAPLGIAGDKSDDISFTRSWLLPVMRASINGADLSYFQEYFLPLSRALGKMSKSYAEAKNGHLSKVYYTLECQIWDLLPGFCMGARDVSSSFKKLAKVLGSYLAERSDCRLVIMSALRNLITHSLVTDAAKTEVARFAKNFLPILFNLYVTLPSVGPEQTQRVSTFQTICSYLSIADESLINTLSNKCLDKLTTESESDDYKTYTFDLLRAMLPYMDISLLGSVWKITKQLLSSENTYSQKAAYRLVEEMCNTDHEHCGSFIKSVRFELIAILKESLVKASSSSKSSRLACISSLLDHLSESDDKFLVEFMPEAVICCKEHNDKCRSAAFSLIVKIGRTLQRWSCSDGEHDEQSAVEAVRKYMQLLLAGLTGSPHMIAATNLAIAQVVHMFKEVFPGDLLELIVENSCLLMSSSSREPVEACLSLVKSLVFAVDLMRFARFLPKLVKALSSMTDDCKRHFRLKVRDILSLFVRKFDYDVVAGLIPKKDVILQKRLKNIKKIEQRKTVERESSREERLKRKSESTTSLPRTKSVEDILHSADHSDEEEDKTNHGARKQDEAWIKESEDDIVDLLDSRASQQITSSKPAKFSCDPSGSRGRSSSHFEFSEDGRLIVNDKTDQKSMKNGSDGDDEDDAGFLEQMQVAGRKRKQRGISLSVASSSRSLQPAAKYRAAVGGSGIFRRLDSPSASNNSVNKKPTASNSYTPGSEYASRKGRGDMKRIGKPDPYAYMPLVRGALNKRKQAKFRGQFKSVVRGAKKGSKSGRKARSNSVNNDK